MFIDSNTIGVKNIRPGNGILLIFGNLHHIMAGFILPDQFAVEKNNCELTDIDIMYRYL